MVEGLSGQVLKPSKLDILTSTPSLSTTTPLLLSKQQNKKEDPPTTDTDALAAQKQPVLEGENGQQRLVVFLV